MKIAIIGGGFTGLAAAYELSKRGHRVTVFEKDAHLGGLAHGFKRKEWDLPRAKSRGWSLEYAYHHLFTNDDAILSLIKELGLQHKLIIKRPITATLISPQHPTLKSKSDVDFVEATRTAQLDSAFHLLTYPGLPMIDKLRTGALLAALKILPWWQPLEGITAEHFFTSLGGKKAWQTIWEPLMIGKFGNYAPTIAASWLWARIKKRTPKLVYIEGGFQTLVDALAKAILRHGGVIHTNTAVINLDQFGQFDRVLLTIPTPIAAKLLSNSQPTTHNLQPSLSIPHLHAQTLILETDKPILKDVYWLNVTDRSFPFLAVVAHTNMVDKKHYGGHHLTYFGNYLPPGHHYLSMTAAQLLKEFMPFIKKLSHNSQFTIHNSRAFIGPFAQPVHQLHYSKRAPKLETGIPGVYLANMDSIYPWDRGTNYAVELGQKAAQVILSSRACLP